MKYTEYKNPEDFLKVCRRVFEDNEALYGLMLGIALRLIKNPLYYGSQPLMATIGSETGLDLIALMTPPYKLQIANFNAKSDASIHLLASKLKENGWNIPAVMGEEKAVKAFASCWKEISNKKSRDGIRQRIYELRSVQPVRYPSGSLRQADFDDLNLAARWAHAFHYDCFGDTEPSENLEKLTKNMIEEGSLYFWADPDPVSTAAFTRPTEHGICVSYVYTPPHLRRKGYATAAVAKLSQMALDSGKEFCTLFTDLSNPTSNSIYQKIGYKPVADIIEVHFSAKIK
jgi:hypothetical protein